ncbi:hypothetical protein SAMN04488515_3456 [Cognatiyoonia koreensis]|uniref:Uncharacterized protein n=1 Tax=Cognatiyoonia koreensis TaxID=364200 RepID=A0A1I0RXK9_9RHOB|nr:hypothetical protein [Cognatiyoonia koreensis]SEW46158.1 hypothetical protein SAMN04488515_3456 [Cognatiyoonia koreensis]
MLDAGRNYVILAAALLVLTASLKLYAESQQYGNGLALLGDGVRKCQSSGFELSTKRIGCQSSRAAIGR